MRISELGVGVSVARTRQKSAPTGTGGTPLMLRSSVSVAAIGCAESMCTWSILKSCRALQAGSAAAIAAACCAGAAAGAAAALVKWLVIAASAGEPAGAAAEPPSGVNSSSWSVVVEYCGQAAWPAAAGVPLAAKAIQ